MENLIKTEKFMVYGFDEPSSVDAICDSCGNVVYYSYKGEEEYSAISNEAHFFNDQYSAEKYLTDKIKSVNYTTY